MVKLDFQTSGHARWNRNEIRLKLLKLVGIDVIYITRNVLRSIMKLLVMRP